MTPGFLPPGGSRGTGAGGLRGGAVGPSGARGAGAGGIGGGGAGGGGRTGKGAGAGTSVTTALATLKDVAGITGSFVFTSGGQLVAREIHAMFDDAALGDAAERLSRLSDTFASVGDELELAVIRFQDHKLYLKVLNGGMLCILADGVVNMAALRMAANLVGRRIATELEHAAAELSPHGAHEDRKQDGKQGREGRAGETEIAGLDDSQRGSRLPGQSASTSVASAPGDHTLPLPSSLASSTASGPPGAVTRQPAFAPGTRRFRGRSLE